MSRKKRRKKNRVNPEERVQNNLVNGCWWTLDGIQRESSVQKSSVRRVLDSNQVDQHVYNQTVFYKIKNEDAVDFDHVDIFINSFSTHNVAHIVGAEELHRVYSGFARSARVLPLSLEAFRDKMRVDKRVAYNSVRDVFYGIHIPTG